MKVRSIVLSGLLVIACILTFAFVLGFDTNQEGQVAYASNDSQTSVCFDEGNTLWFNMPDDNIYCHGAESFDEDSTGAFAKIDYVGIQILESSKQNLVVSLHLFLISYVQ